MMVQLRQAIQADTDMPAQMNRKVDAASDHFQPARGWLRQQLTAELGSVLLDTLGLAAAIEWHLHRCRKCTGILYKLEVNNTAGFDLSEEHAAATFDIYSEALSNAARHAAASQVAVALTITPQKVILMVHDNGIGLGEQASRSSRGGIAGMRARARSFDGLCEVAGVRDAGTTVTVSLPIARVS